MEFIREHILLIVTILAFILFAIIGDVVDKTKNQNNKEKEILKETTSDEIAPNVETTEIVENTNTNDVKDKNVNLDDLNK